MYDNYDAAEQLAEQLAYEAAMYRQALRKAELIDEYGQDWDN